MPLPGLNPVEKAPPAGSTKTIATGSSVAQLHQRISDLERRVAAQEKLTTSGWQDLPLVPGTTTGYGTSYWPKYRKIAGTVELGGLIKNVVQFSVSAVAMATLPVKFRPVDYNGVPQSHYYITQAWHGAGYFVMHIVIQANGQIQNITPVPWQINGYCSMDGITFYAGV